MRIVQENIDREDYLELCVTPKEIECLTDYMIISQKFYINGIVTNVGIKLEMEEEENEKDYPEYF